MNGALSEKDLKTFDIGRVKASQVEVRNVSVIVNAVLAGPVFAICGRYL